MIGTVTASDCCKPPIIAIAMQTPPPLRFDVMRNNSRIGQHAIGFGEESGVLVVKISVEIAVGLGPIKLYRYTHKVRENWRDGSFLSLESETNDNGKRYRVSAARTPEHVVVTSSATGRAVFDPHTIPLTHWNRLCVERALFNPQDGARMTPKVEVKGVEHVRLLDGRKVAACRYSLLLKPALDNWYDSAGHWIALRTSAWDGSIIEYRRAG